MDEQRIITFLKAVGSEPCEMQNRDEWVLAPCPFAPWFHEGGVDNHPSFGVEKKPNEESRFYCFSCNANGDLMDMIINLKHEGAVMDDGYNFPLALTLIAEEQEEAELDIPDYGEGVVKPKVITQIFAEQFLESFKKAKFFKDGLQYLKSRGLNPLEIHELDFRFDSKHKRVCIPVRDFNGKLMGLHGRSIIKGTTPPYNAYKYNNHWNKLPWLGEEWIDFEIPVVLCESVFDFIQIRKVYRNVMCSLSCGMGKAKVDRIRGALDVVSLYDYGKGGDMARKSLHKYLKSSTIVHLIPTKEQDDPGAMTEVEIYNLLKGYVDFNLEGI